MTEEARAEGVAVRSEIRNRPVPSKQAQAPDTLAIELRGASFEALGDDRRAAESYAQRLELLVNSLVRDVHPSQLTSLREWWVGRAYAQCLLRTGKAEATLASLQKELENSVAGKDRLADLRLHRVLMGLLLDAKGQRVGAETQWSLLIEKDDLRSAAAPTVVLPKL